MLEFKRCPVNIGPEAPARLSKKAPPSDINELEKLTIDPKLILQNRDSADPGDAM